MLYELEKIPASLGAYVHMEHYYQVVECNSSTVHKLGIYMHFCYIILLVH